MGRTKGRKKSVFRRSSRRARGYGRALLAAVLAVAGCVPLSDNVLTNDGGEPIRLAEIAAIVSDDSLNEDQKRQALEDLGVTNEDLLDVFLR